MYIYIYVFIIYLVGGQCFMCNWFLNLEISCTIHLRAKEDDVQFCFCY